MTPIRNFLLVFDRERNALIGQFDFGSDVESATLEYSRLENKYCGNRAIDAVMVGSDSIETVKITHANYFDGESRRLMDEALNLFAS